MSNINRFPKQSNPNNHDSLDSEEYTETDWASLADAVPFVDDEPDQPTNETIESDFDDIANMIINNSTSGEDQNSNPNEDPDLDFGENQDTLASESAETSIDRNLEIAIAGNFLSYLEIQLDKSKQPGERQELTELISIGEDYYGFIIDEDDNKSPTDIFNHLEKKYTNLSKLYQRENRQYLASKYANRANLLQNRFADHYEHFAATHGRDEPDHPSSDGSPELSPDALSSDLIA